MKIHRLQLQPSQIIYFNNKNTLGRKCMYKFLWKFKQSWFCFAWLRGSLGLLSLDVKFVLGFSSDLLLGLLSGNDQRFILNYWFITFFLKKKSIKHHWWINTNWIYFETVQGQSSNKLLKLSFCDSKLWILTLE